MTCVPSDVLASANVHVHTFYLCLSIQRKILNDIVTKRFIHCSHEIFLVVLMCECV